MFDTYLYTELLRRAVREATPGVLLGSEITAAVTGGRDFEDLMLLNATMNLVDHLIHIDVFVNGHARGVDRMALEWAVRHRKTTRSLPARWKADGNAAGPLRNSAMVDILVPRLPNAFVVAFPGGEGTFDMIMKCKDAGIPVIDVQLVLDQMS